MTEPDLIRLWQAQPEEFPPMTTEALRKGGARLHTGVRVRNVIEIAAAAVVVVVFTLYAIHADSGWVRAGGAAIVLATAWVVWKLLRDGQGAAAPAEASGAALVAFLREQLTRQRNLVNTAGRWYLAPFIPGFVLLAIGRWQGDPAQGRTVEHDHQIILLSNVIIVLGLLVVWLFNKLTAARLSRQIEELDKL